MRIDPSEPLRARTPWLPLAGLIFLLLPVLPVSASEDKTEPAGTLSHELPPKPAVQPDDPEAAGRVLSRTSGGQGETDWHGSYVRAPGEALPASARMTLRLATEDGYDRTQAIHDLKHGGERVRPLITSLDIGRHEILKHLYQRAMIVANAELEKQGLSSLNKVQAVNAGGTGDYTRDQDITVFAGDEIREKAYFDAIVKVARDELKLTTDVKETGGVDFPEIEVTFFPGGNDLPDARFATDVEAFALKYQRAIAKQAADAEAYKGGGADIEVKGRRVPGKMYVQQLTWENGRPVYVAETPNNYREGRSLFSGTAPERWQRFERAAHIFSDFVQGRQHAGGEGHDLTKGPLKYTGRAIEHFCRLHGMKPWSDLKQADRIALLRRVWPHIDPESPRGRSIYNQIIRAIDLSVEVKTHKALPDGTDPAVALRQERMALRFLHNATAASISQMARDMLDPPAFDTTTMRRIAGDRWDSMSSTERFAFARRNDQRFRAATGRAAMENLLVAVSLLRNMDFQDGKLASRRPGARAIARILAEADADMRPVLELSSKYAEAWARKQQTSDPKIRAECDAMLMDVRGKLVKHCPLAPNEMPSLATLRKAAKDGPRAVLDTEMRWGRSWFTPEMQEVRQAFQEHFKQAFPSHAEQWRNFRGHIQQHGMKDYVWNRFCDEVVQWDTVADLLTLVELYQADADRWDYAAFIGLNVGSRVHWAIGPLAQALMVYDKDPKVALQKFKELGKSVVFLTLARIVPWAGSVKIAFDVMRGTVVVTVGWAVNQANRDLIDALYTGEAGRKNMKAAGTVLGRIRDSGICVLPADVVERRTNPKTKALTIGIDRAGLYRTFFKRWTGVEAGHVPRSTPPPGDAARFTMAHDMFVRVLIKQAEQYGPIWVPSPEKPFVPLRLGEKEVEDTLGALHPFLHDHAARVVDAVLARTAPRSYRSYMEKDGFDAIREGLVGRFQSDLLAGMFEHWQVRITAQVLAARDIERTAVFQDWRVIADRLHRDYVPSSQRRKPLGMRLEGGRWRPARSSHGTMFTSPEGGSRLTFKLDARADGVPVLGGAALDGSQPVRLSATLRGTGETGDDERPVKFEVTTRTLRRIRKVGDPDDDGPLAAGDVVEDVVLVRALADEGKGPELARREITLRVLLPESGEVRKVPLLRRTEHFRDGRLRRRYVFFKRFKGMPAAWNASPDIPGPGYGEVLHGTFEMWHGDGKTLGGTSEWRYGHQHGLTQDFNLKGQLIRQVPFLNGIRQGEEIRFDPDSAGRLVITHVNDRIVSKSATGTTGKPMVEITYRYKEAPNGRLLMSGTAARWWANGEPRWRGRYADADLDLNRLGGQNAEGIYGKVGAWEFFHENGKHQERSTYRAGRLDGPTETFDEKGRRVHRGRLTPLPSGRGSVPEGVWSSYDPPGTLKERTTWKVLEKDNIKHGLHEEFHANGELSRTGRYIQGIPDGIWRDFNEKGVMVGETPYDKGVVHGTLRTWFHTGDAETSVEYVDGKKRGTARTWEYDRENRHHLSLRELYDEAGFTFTAYHPNGNPARRGRAIRIPPEREGDEPGYALDGIVQTFYETGVRESETTYHRGEKHGPYRGFDAEGRETTEGAYLEGERHGRWIYTDHFPGGGSRVRADMYNRGKVVK